MKLRGVLREGGKAVLFSNLVYGLNFTGNLVLVRLLLPEDFGAVALALSLVGMVEIFTTFSVHTVFIQRRSTESLTRTVFQITALSVGFKIAVGLAIAVFVLRHYDITIWILFGLILGAKLFTAFGTLLVAVLEKQGQFFQASVIVNSANLTAVVVAISAVWMGAGIYGLVMREALPSVLVFAFMCLLRPGLWPGNLNRVNRRQLSLVARGTAQMFFQRGAEIAYMRAPLIAVEAFFGSATLGLLAQATYLVTAVNRITGVANTQIAPVFFSHNRKNQAQSRQARHLLWGFSMALGLPVAALLFAFPGPIISLLWGDEWLGARLLLRGMAGLAILLPLFAIAKSQLAGQRKNNAITMVYGLGLGGLMASLWLARDFAEPLALLGWTYLGSYLVITGLCVWLAYRSDHSAALMQRLN